MLHMVTHIQPDYDAILSSSSICLNRYGAFFRQVSTRPDQKSPAILRKRTEKRTVSPYVGTGTKYTRDPANLELLRSNK